MMGLALVIAVAVLAFLAGFREGRRVSKGYLDATHESKGKSDNERDECPDQGS